MLNLNYANLLIYEANCKMIDRQPGLTRYQRLHLKGEEHRRLCEEQMKEEVA